MKAKLRSLTTAVVFGLLFSLPNLTFAQETYQQPTALAMTGDLVLARPALLVMTVVGAAAFVVSLPFSALGGNVGSAADTLVVGPGKATFVRCLGCTNGRKSRGSTCQCDKTPPRQAATLFRLCHVFTSLPLNGLNNSTLCIWPAVKRLLLKFH